MNVPEPFSPSGDATTPPPTIGGGGSGTLGHRHRRVISKPPLSRSELKRLARRGGVLQMGRDVPEEMRAVLRSFLSGVIKDAIVFAEHSRRKTVSTHDVVLSLKRSGNSSWHTILYGFDDDGVRRRRRHGGAGRPVAYVNPEGQGEEGLDESDPFPPLSFPTVPSESVSVSDVNDSHL